MAWGRAGRYGVRVVDIVVAWVVLELMLAATGCAWGNNSVSDLYIRVSAGSD